MIVWILSIAVALILLMTLGLVLFTAWTAHQVETKMPPRGKFIDIDGVRLHYIDKGNGPPLVLIHGLAGQVLNFTHSLLGILDPALHAQGFVAKVPGPELEMTEGAGHMLLISSADQVAAFVARIAHRAAATDAPLAPVG